MPLHNSEIARMFTLLADLLEIDGANPFRVNAYRNAARTVGQQPHAMADLVAEGKDLTELPAIGKDLAKKIETAVETGNIPALDKIRERVPESLAHLMQIPGLGAKRVRALWQELGIENEADLRKAVEGGKVRELEGFGAKSAENIREALERFTGEERRMLLAEAEPIAESLLEHLRGLEGVKAAEVAGSFRRRRETVGDLDILVTCKRGTKVSEHFVAYDEVSEVVSQGSTRSTVKLRSGLQVDLRVVPEVSFGAALHYFTGSKSHNIAVRTMGVRRKLKINEYGVFRGKRRVAGRTEAEVYEKVGLPYIEPELRENRGELEAAAEDRLPALVELDDIRGDLHAHTDASDGRSTLKEMAEAARARGYAYLAISDHTRHLTVAHGQDAKRLAKQIAAIDKLNEKLKGFRLLKSAEVDILEDGSLDLERDILEQLDFTVCSIHDHFILSRNAQTERILRAMEHPCFHILGHPVGRLIGEREPYDVDLERVMHAAKERGCVLELNSQPQRLDLTDVACRMAKEIGVKVAISTDAHHADSLALMRFGIGQARRGWLEPDDVVNTRPLKQLLKLLRRN